MTQNQRFSPFSLMSCNEGDCLILPVPLPPVCDDTPEETLLALGEHAELNLEWRGSGGRGVQEMPWKTPGFHLDVAGLSR